MNENFHKVWRIRVLISSIALSWASIVQGYIISYPSSAFKETISLKMILLNDKLHPYSMSALSAVFGPPVIRTMTSITFRRTALAFISVVIFLSFILRTMALSENSIAATVMRISIGFSSGVLSYLIPSMFMDFSLPNERTIYVYQYYFFLIIGVALSNVMSIWSTLFDLCIIGMELSFILFIVALLIPDSIAQSPSRFSVPRVHQTSLFRSQHKKSIFICTFICLIKSFSGTNMFLMSMRSLYSYSEGITADFGLLSFITLLPSLVSNRIFSRRFDNVGSKGIWSLSIVFTSVFLFLLDSAVCRSLPYLPLIVSMIMYFFFSLSGIMVFPLVIIDKVFPQEVRDDVMTFFNMLDWFFSFLMTFYLKFLNSLEEKEVYGWISSFSFFILAMLVRPLLEIANNSIDISDNESQISEATFLYPKIL